ncbi:MAG: flagellar hook capping FlgD N-terminal domain-containing protein [Planctomycetaceae bacterium]
MNTAPNVNGVDKGQYLNLLVAQLQNQDPLKPMDQQEQVAQLAQFSMVEGIDRLNTRFDQFFELQMLGNGRNLLGSTVEFHSNDGLIESGIVERISAEDSGIVLTVNGHAISMDQVAALVNPVDASTS